MLYIVLGYLLVSALIAILLWSALIVAKRSDNRGILDICEDEPSQEESEEREVDHVAQ